MMDIIYCTGQSKMTPTGKVSAAMIKERLSRLSSLKASHQPLPMTISIPRSPKEIQCGVCYRTKKELFGSARIIWFASGMPPGEEGVCSYDGTNLVSFKPKKEGWFRKIREEQFQQLDVVLYTLKIRNNGPAI
jgi:hypothetical protein